MYQVIYSQRLNYRPLTYVGLDGRTRLTTDLPALEIVLRRGEIEYPAIAQIDTGSMFSLFSLQVGEYLGLPVQEGRREHLTTLAGSLMAYAHTVELEIAHGWSLGEVEILFSEQDIPRNLLGRSDFLVRVQVGLWERAGIIYLKKDSP